MGAPGWAPGLSPHISSKCIEPISLTVEIEGFRIANIRDDNLCQELKSHEVEVFDSPGLKSGFFYIRVVTRRHPVIKVADHDPILPGNAVAL